MPRVQPPKKKLQGEDWSSLCCKCGEADDPAKSCTVTHKCFLFVKEDSAIDCGHVAGSYACVVFRRALEADKKEERWKRPKRN